MKKYLVLAASMSVLGFASAHAQEFPSGSYENSARITQTGNANEAEIEQAADGILNGQSRAEIIQNGDRNEASIAQTSATSPFNSGFANTALIDQRRNGGVASIEQIHDYNVSRSNNATILQTSRDAVGSVRQRGDRNTVRLISWSAPWMLPASTRTVARTRRSSNSADRTVSWKLSRAALRQVPAPLL